MVSANGDTAGAGPRSRYTPEAGSSERGESVVPLLHGDATGGNPMHRIVQEHNRFPRDMQESSGKTKIDEREQKRQVREMIKWNAFNYSELDIRQVHYHNNALARSVNGWSTEQLVRIMAAANQGGYMKNKSAPTFFESLKGKNMDGQDVAMGRDVQ